MKINSLKSYLRTSLLHATEATTECVDVVSRVLEDITVKRLQFIVGLVESNRTYQLVKQHSYEKLFLTLNIRQQYFVLDITGQSLRIAVLFKACNELHVYHHSYDNL